MTSNSTTQTKFTSDLETNNTACTIVQKDNVRIPVDLNLISENLEFNKNMNGLKINAVQVDTVCESSEDIFTSTPKEVNSKGGIDPGDNGDIDQVILIPGPDELYRIKENIRNKNQLSKLRLSKYKKKNLVNPVRVEKTFVKEKENMITVEEAKRQVSSVVQKQLNCPDKSDMMDIEACKLKIGKESSSLSNINVHTNCSAQGTVFSEGEVIVFERQLRKADKDNGVSKPSQECSVVKNNRKSLGNLVSQSSIESSLSTLYDTELGKEVEENTKIRRRSGSRKRRSSGLEAQRRSARISAHSSQDTWSQSTEAEVISPVFVTANNSSAKKRVVISSVFQCLIDEGRRRNEIEEFNIPTDVLESRFQTKTFPDQTDTDIDKYYNQSFLKTQGSELMIKDERMINEDQISFKTELPNEICEMKPELSNLPTTETYQVNLLEQDDVISPTLFESQPSDNNVFSFSEETITDKADDLKSVTNDLVNEEYGLIKKGNEPEDTDIKQVDKGSEQLIIQTEQMNKGSSLKNKENEKDDQLIPEKVGENCLAGTVILDQQHIDQNINMESDVGMMSSGLQLQQIGDFEVN